MKKLIISFIMLIFSLICFVSVVFAWFTHNISINNIIIKTGNVNAEATLYKGQDYNLDGNLDTDSLDSPIYLAAEEFASGISPNDTYSYMLAVKNTGDYDGVLKITFGEFTGDLQYVLVNSSNALYTGNNITAAENIILAKGHTYNLYFTMRFATLSELIVLNGERFGSLTDLNTYFDKTFSMKIYVNLEQR